MPSQAATRYNRDFAKHGSAKMPESEIGTYYHPSTVICAEHHYRYAFMHIVENIADGIVFDGEISQQIYDRDAVDVYMAAKILTADEMVNIITSHARWARVPYGTIAKHVRPLYRRGKELGI